MNDFVLYATCAFAVVTGVTGHLFLAIATCALGIALCLAIIHNRDKQP